MHKTTLLTLIALAIALTSFGQAPEAFKYQAVVRDAGGVILTNQAVGYQLTILQGSPSGTAVYTETFSPTTNGSSFLAKCFRMMLTNVAFSVPGGTRVIVDHP